MKLDKFQTDIEVCVIDGVEGKALVVNGRRVAGPKPWGGGSIIKEWKVPVSELFRSLYLDWENDRFKPSETYEGLLVQSNALFQLSKASSKIQSTYMKRDYSLSEKRLNGLEKSLESEKEMNAILTDELEKDQKRISYLEECLKIAEEKYETETGKELFPQEGN